MKAKKLIIIIGIVTIFLMSSLSATSYEINKSEIKNQKLEPNMKSLFSCNLIDNEFSESISRSTRLYSEIDYDHENAIAAASLAVHYYGLEYINWGNENYWLYKFRLNTFFKVNEEIITKALWLRNMKIIASPKEGIVDPGAPAKGGMNVTDGNWVGGSNVWKDAAVFVCSKAIAKLNPYVAVGVSAANVASSLIKDTSHNSNDDNYIWYGVNTPTEASGFLDFGFFVEPNKPWKIELDLEVNLRSCCPQADWKMRLDGRSSWCDGDGKMIMEHTAPPSPRGLKLGNPQLGPFYVNSIPFSVLPEEPNKGIELSLSGSSNSASITLDEPSDPWYGFYDGGAYFPGTRIGVYRLTVRTSSDTYTSDSFILLDFM